MVLVHAHNQIHVSVMQIGKATNALFHNVLASWQTVLLKSVLDEVLAHNQTLVSVNLATLAQSAKHHTALESLQILHKFAVELAHAQKKTLVFAMQTGLDLHAMLQDVLVH